MPVGLCYRREGVGACWPVLQEGGCRCLLACATGWGCRCLLACATGWRCRCLPACAIGGRV